MAAPRQSRPPSGPAPVYGVCGPDDFLRRQHVEDIVRLVVGDDRDSLAVADFDGNAAELADVLDECRTASLLAPMRLVRVRDADGFVSRHRKALEDYCGAPSPTGVLLLVCRRKWPANWKLYKLVDKVGRVIICEPPKGPALAAWAVRHAHQAYGCRLEPAAARRLAELVDDNLGMLDTELGKLSAYVAPQTIIGVEAVEELVGMTRMAKVFGIADAIGRRDAVEALSLWEQVLSTDRAAPYRSIGGLTHVFRNLAEARRFLDEGAGPVEAFRRARVWADSPALAGQLRKFPLKHWRDYLVKLLRIDLGAKSGLGNAQSGVEKLIVEACAASS